MARFRQYVRLLSLLPVAWCRVENDIRPTQTNFGTDQFDFEWGWTPMPTSAPRVLGGLQRRQQDDLPNDTCGFINGVASSTLTCPGNLFCGFTAGSDYNVAACCTGSTYITANAAYLLTSCDFYTTCYDYTALAECDLSCQANTNAWLCTDAASPYCLTESWTDTWSGYTALNCHEFSGVTVYLAYTANAPSAGSTTTTSPPGTIYITVASTTTAQPSTTVSTTPSTTLSTTVPTPPVVVTTSSTSSDPSTLTSSITNPSSSSTSVSPTSSALGPIQSTTSTTSSSSSPTSSAGGPIVVTTIPGSNGPPAGTTVSTITSSDAGSSSPQNTTNPTPSKSSSNTGAIAGGVVGGVAILALAAFLLWFCLRRRNRGTADGAGPPVPEISEYSSRVQSPYSGGPVSPNTQGPSQYGSPEQVHEFPTVAGGGGAAAVGAAGMYGRSHPTDHLQSGYQPGQYQNQYGQPVERAHEISSDGTGSSGRPLNPNSNHYGGYNPNSNPNATYSSANAPEVVQQQQQQGGYRGLDPTGGGYNHLNADANAHASYGADPGFYGRPYGEMP